MITRLSPSLLTLSLLQMRIVPALLLNVLCLAAGSAQQIAGSVHTWEKVEVTLTAEKTYDNPYAKVEVWVDLQGPEFNKRCYGFWDGGNTFKVRVLATKPGTWHWTSHSNQDDPGLNGKEGSFQANTWTQAEKGENPLRRGMVVPSRLQLCAHSRGFSALGR